MSDYEILKRFGFSPAKAAEIDLDNKRGDEYARRWVSMARTFDTMPAPKEPK